MRCGESAEVRRARRISVDGVRRCRFSGSAACQIPVKPRASREIVLAEDMQRQRNVSTCAAFVFDDGLPALVGGLTLTERAILLTAKAGCEPIHVCGPRPLDRASVARLKARGVSPVQRTREVAPLEGIGDVPVMVVRSGVLFGPAVLTALAGAARGGKGAVVSEAGAALLLYLPAARHAAVHACRSIDEMADTLATHGALQAIAVDGMFVRRVSGAKDIAAVERAYIRHLTGKGESYFTKKIRRFSVPLTTHLVRLGARPAHVTLGGLVLAIAAAWLIARGSYVAGLAGALLCYASMIGDCSDGEVARVTLREGPFGAWLETIVDYVTYFLLLAAIVTASQSRAHADAYRTAAWIALGGSVIVSLVAGYLRHRVAAADPGQFDDASAKALAASSRFHRFARWGRQWIKRSSVTHLVVFLAIVNQLPVLLYLWAFGATVATVVILIVEPFVVRRVAVTAADGHAQVS